MLTNSLFGKSSFWLVDGSLLTVSSHRVNEKVEKRREVGEIGGRKRQRGRYKERRKREVQEIGGRHGLKMEGERVQGREGGGNGERQARVLMSLPLHEDTRSTGLGLPSLTSLTLITSLKALFSV